MATGRSNKSNPAAAAGRETHPQSDRYPPPTYMYKDMMPYQNTCTPHHYTDPHDFESVDKGDQIDENEELIRNAISCIEEILKYMKDNGKVHTCTESFCGLNTILSEIQAFNMEFVQLFELKSFPSAGKLCELTTSSCKTFVLNVQFIVKVSY
jgi:hypothetical protein